MSYEKQNFVDGQTLTAAHLNHMEEGIAAAGGFTAGAKELLLTLFENAAYKTGDAQSALNALRAEWGGSAQDIPVQSVSLSAAILNLSEGESQTLTAMVLPANAANKLVWWSVSPAGLATVAGGTVTAVKITATCNPWPKDRIPDQPDPPQPDPPTDTASAVLGQAVLGKMSLGRNE